MLLLLQVFYVPLALLVPPVLILVHQQLSLLYQIWIHTETIPTLGLLNYFFNTPAYHRVHHGNFFILKSYQIKINRKKIFLKQNQFSGSNLYCLDKNYGGVLIIWDRIFGTFRDFSQKKPITYGLVYQKNTFNPLYLQVNITPNSVLIIFILLIQFILQIVFLQFKCILQVEQYEGLEEQIKVSRQRTELDTRSVVDRS